MGSTGRWLSKELLAEARREAKITADSHTFEDHCECICPQNLLLWAFLRQLQTATRRASGGAADLRDSASLTFGNAAKAVKEAPWRVWNHEVAQKLKGIGSTTASVIKSLFAEYPQDEPTQEELEAMHRAEASGKAVKAQVAKAKAASAKEAKKRAAAVSAAAGGGGTAGGMPMRQQRDPNAATPSVDEEAGPNKKAKKPPKAKKSYRPKPATANFAFLVIMYKGHKMGEEHFSKEVLMRRAEDSHISATSMYGDQNPMAAYKNGAQFYYNGWSSLKQMEQKDPPLIQIWSNPLKCRLTPDGMKLGEELYLELVQDGKVDPLPSSAVDATPSVAVPVTATNGAAPGGGLGAGRQRPGQQRPAPGIPSSVLPPERGSHETISTSTKVGSHKYCGSAPPLKDDDEEVICIDDSSDDEEGSAPALQSQSALPPSQESRQSALPQDLSQPGPSSALTQAVLPRTVPLHERLLRQQLAARCGSQDLMGVGGSGSLPSSQEQTGRSGSSQFAEGYRRCGDWRLESVQSPADQMRSLRSPPLPPGRDFADVYDVWLIVDGREQFSTCIGGQRLSKPDALEHHIDRIRACNVKVEKRQLPAGDACWIAKSKLNPGEEYVLDALLERKSVSDLEGSIKSKRADTQKYYMKTSGLRMLYYLVEGHPHTLHSPHMQKAVKTVIVQNEIIHGYRVLRTENPHQSHHMLANLTQALEAMYRRLRADPEGYPAQLPTYERFKRTVGEHKTLTVRDVWGKMLSVVKGVGPNAVESIIEKYPTPISLYREYERVKSAAVTKGEEPTRAAREMLSSIPLLSSSRTVGPVSSQSIYDSLFHARSQP